MKSPHLGFTLIEVLVALVVLSIGLLGLAGLQVTALQRNHSANLRTQATLLAYDMADRIRASRSVYLDGTGAYTNPPTGTTAKVCEWNGTTVQACTATELAQYDLAHWRQAVQNTLPDGVATICRDSTPNDGAGDTNGNDSLDDLAEHGCDNSGAIYAVKLWWTDEFNTDTGAPVIKRFVTTFQP